MFNNKNNQMFRAVIMRSLMAIALVFTLPLQTIHAQFEEISTPELKTTALADYEAGHYSSSLNKYGALIKRYPKDGVFHYFSGLCLFNMNKNISTAVKYLQFAASKPNVPSDVFYFLGEAYMQNYQFPEAKKAYTQFSDIATKTELKELIPMRKAEMAENAIVISKQYNTVDIIASSLFIFQDSVYLKQIRAVGGVLGYKPVQLRSPREKNGDLSNLCFISQNPAKGDYLYYSGYGRSMKRGTDLYRVKILGDKRLSDPELLESLSTAYNEVLPYYDPIGKDLYFASPGYSSMGGYDVFKSHLNQENNTWSEPKNLGFPVNSPSNEYVFLPGTDLGSVLLITDRQGLDTMLTVYILRIKEPKKSLSSADNEELKRIGKFGGIESIPDIIDIAEKGIPVEDTLKAFSGLKPSEIRPVIRKDIQTSSEYNKYLKMALNYQFKSDSLARLAREARINVKSIPDPDERWAIQSNIILWEKLSADAQAKADEYYVLVKNLETGKSAEKNFPASFKKDTVINNRAKNKNNLIQGVSVIPIKKADTALVVNKVVPVIGKVVDEVKSSPKKGDAGNQFTVLEKSPYSAENPFPGDIAIPAGAFYRIQLGVFSKKVEWDYFLGLSPITSESVTGKPMTRYYAGKFTNFESAKASLNIVKSKGYRDGFIAAWYNGQKLAAEKVVEFEKRDGK